jgi:hypothetical protein
MKDAVPHFNGGCTSEVISPKAIAYQSPLWLFSNSIALFS